MDLTAIPEPESQPVLAKRARPFLKWAGGKAKLAERIISLMPQRFGNYYEPFTGGGAAFFALAGQRKYDRCILNDFNHELATTYREVRDNVESVIVELEALKADYAADTQTTYYRERDTDPGRLSFQRQAARFIFLNKTGFNGMFRVNSKGKFNVPIGKFSTPPTIVDRTNLQACSAALQGVEFRCGDFQLNTESAASGDVVYLDPPYVPLNPTSSFTSYTSAGFGKPDQERLASFCRNLVDRGVRVIASNSDTPLVRELYTGFELIEVQMSRSINSKGDKRGKVGELLIVGGTL